MKAMWEALEALLILHNILTEFRDNPYEIEGFNVEEEANLTLQGTRIFGFKMPQAVQE